MDENDMTHIKRWLLALPPAIQTTLKLALLAVAVPSFVMAVEADSTLAGIVCAVAAVTLWCAHGWTAGFDDTGPPVVYEMNPASGEPLMPGAHGLDTRGNPSGSRG
jgi:hypothetical protein